uniref:THAP domain-containing protein 1 n=1 Tax=Maylandia zebra TaxID=106582 RepID=A0A3P9DIF5_9CICH
MDRTCCVVGCNVRSHDREGKKLDNGLSFHRFPSWRQREGSHAWIAAVRRADIEFSAIPSFLLVCSRHFLSSDESVCDDRKYKMCYYKSRKSAL